MRRYISHSISFAMLVIFLIAAFAHPACAQDLPFIQPLEPSGNPQRTHHRVDTIYVMPGEKRFIKLMDGSDDSKWWTYFRWYNYNEGYKEHMTWLKERIITQNNYYNKYSNGYAFFNWTAKEDSRCYIHYQAPSRDEFNPVNGIVDIVACDVSLLKTVNKPTEPNLSGRYLFYIKDAREQYKVIQNYKDKWTGSNDLTKEIIADHSKYFKEFVETHAPMGSLGVTLRMKEDIQNYVLFVEKEPQDGEFQKYCADRVRWTVYQKRGESLERIGFKHKVVKDMRTVDESGTNETNIIKANFNNIASAKEEYFAAPHTLYFFDDSETQMDTQEQKELYITAEVSRGENGEWYPITLIHLFLEPYASLTTQEELKTIADKVNQSVKDGSKSQLTEIELSYYMRTPEYISDNFEVLDSITFDIQDDFNRPTSETNYAKGGFGSSEDEDIENRSSYLFAYPAQRQDNHTSPRYSYALYKSLNMPGVSNGDTFGYSDWWMGIDRYNVQLNDRRHEQNPNEYGYFLYVDAAEKPGTLATLRLNNNLCSDTRILVTAWVANMQSNIAPTSSCLPADIGLTFYGVSENGERTQINKFYSGSARRTPKEGNGEQHAQWQQIYFHFDFQEGDIDYDHYLLELANNTSHSNGADYAIDDIKVYRSKVDFGAAQLTPHCEDDSIRLVVYGEYDNLMFTAAKNEVNEKGEPFDIYFRFYKTDGSIIKFDYNNEGPESVQTFGRMTINTCYNEMDEFNPSNPEYAEKHGVAFRKVDKFGKRFVVFTTKVPNNKEDGTRPLEPGGTYYVQLQPCPGDEGHNHDDSNQPKFEWNGTDGKEAFMQFIERNKCKLISSFSIREATAIRIDGVPILENEGERCLGSVITLSGQVQVYDFSNGVWYENRVVPFDWFIKSGEEEKDREIADLLKEFRTQYPQMKEENEIRMNLQEDEKNKPLLDAAFPTTGVPTVYFAKTEIGYNISKQLEKGELSVFAHPVEPENWNDIIGVSGDVVVNWCTQPKDISLKIGGPRIVLGFNDVDYPEDYTAGIRIGQKQIVELSQKSVSDNMLYIPINQVIPSKGIDQLKTGKKDYADAIHAIVYDSTDPDFKEKETSIAKIESLEANRNLQETGNYLLLDFSEGSKFKPKEGHEYKARIFFQDVPNGTEGDIICDGQVDFIFRIVPEYLTWNGGDNLNNWNNDKAWKRSDRKVDLYFTEPDPETDLEKAFAPMKFSYVTVKAGNSPYLYTAEPDKEKGGVLNLTLDKPEKIGDASKNIEYDLMVKEADAVYTYRFDCEKYYTNTAKEIYFKPEATLMNQQLLTYEKAHVDFEMTNKQRYWLASPLQSVVAGDMYAPSYTSVLKARQETAAFEPITYKNDDNNRFNPAFFQRSWDRAVNMYLHDIDSPKTYEAVRSNWSIEYNDVTVPYSLGKGFYASVEMGTGENADKALVRLPKNDQRYDYKAITKAASPEINRKNNGKIAESATITLPLNPENNNSTPTANPDGDARHYLVGNPYMTYLDMDKFFETNSFLKKKYWVLEDDIVQAAIQDNETWTGGRSSGTIAPMTAFFVEKESGSNGTSISFNPEMMNPAPKDPAVSTRAMTAGNPRLTLIAERNGRKSQCVITQKDNANNQYDGDEDAVVLLDPHQEEYPTVYSIAGNQATIYNSVKDWKNIPIGIYSDSKEEVTLTFEGMEQLAEPIYLYDALTKEIIRLDALNPQMTVPGSTHGRYFLNGTEQLTAENAIAVYSPTPGQLVVAAPVPETLKQIWIYTIAGQLVQAANGLDTSVQTFNLPKGIYMVEATSEQAITKTKVHVR